MDRLRESPVAYFLTLENLYCQLEPAADQIATLMRPEFMPAEFAGRFRRNVDTTPAACRERLRRTLENRLARLRTTEEQLRTGRDARQRRQVVDPNMMIANPAELNTYSRYASDANSSFLRCYKALEAALKADAERGESADQEGNHDPSGQPAGPTPAATAPAGTETSVSPDEAGLPSSESSGGSVGCVEHTERDQDTTIGVVHAPDEPSRTAPAGCVKRTDIGPGTAIGALHAPYETIASAAVAGPEAAEPANPFPTNEPSVPACETTGSSVETITYVDQAVARGTHGEPSVPPSDGPGEPPVPPSDGKFLVRASAGLLKRLGPEAAAPPRLGAGPWSAGPPGEAGSRM
jgi:hypothetical protein